MLVVKVNLGKLTDNIKFLSSKTNAQICAVIKADAYGHGDCIAKHLECLVDAFAVSSPEEAEKVSFYGIDKPIYILTPVIPDKVVKNFVYTLTSIEQVARINDLYSGFPINVSIKLNTGMNRFGVSENEFIEVKNAVYACHNLRLDSVFTHFYDASSVIENEFQYKRFRVLTENLKDIKLHCAASTAFFCSKLYHADMVRIGLATYGYGNTQLTPVMTVSTTVMRVAEVLKGEHIGYGDFVASKNMRIAVIGAGYADGYRRIGKKERFVSFGGRLLRVLSVCMDVSIVEVGGVQIAQGDEVYLLGDAVSAQNLADSYETIIYEVLTSFKGNRVKRIYE